MPRSLQWFLSLRFPQQDPIHSLSSPIHATCPAHPILLDFITRTILGEQYKSFSSSLCNLLHSPRYLVLPRSKYSPQHHVLKHPQLLIITIMYCVDLQYNKRSIQVNFQQKYVNLYLLCFVLLVLCFSIVSFMYIYSYLLCLYYYKDYCHRVTIQS